MQGKYSGWEIFILRKNGVALKLTAQRGDGVNIPLDVQAVRNTVSGHGGDGLVIESSEQRELFSTVMILWFYIHYMSLYAWLSFLLLSYNCHRILQ